MIAIKICRIFIVIKIYTLIFCVILGTGKWLKLVRSSNENCKHITETKVNSNIKIEKLINKYTEF